MAAHIEDYALIGDCETAALVGRGGSIDWLCWPRFDSAACFAALLGSEDNGRWLIETCDRAPRLSRRYREQTLILETEIETGDGAATIIDFMPPREKSSDVVRLVYGRRGELAMQTELVVRFDYGSMVPWVTRLEDGALRAVKGPDMVVLRTQVPLYGEKFKTVGKFRIAAGQVIPFVLTYGASHLSPPPCIDPFEALDRTEAFWWNWASRARPTSQWSDPIIRSLLTLKSLTHRPTGAIVASPTTSLPERLKGQRNWDYRFCWLRDATFTLLTLMNAGYFEDAMAWRQWLLRAVAGDANRVQIMYGVTGEHRLPEWEVPWLDGFGGAKPVRAGNAAAQQLQIDVFGEVMDAIYHGRRGKLTVDDNGWNLQRSLVEHLQTIWEQPDHGIWEIRGDRQCFTHSRVMAWVAFDRAVRTIEQFHTDGPVERWRALRDEIHDEVCRLGFDPDVGAFVQAYGSTHLDASALLIPLVGFLPPQDVRIRSTVEAIQRHLLLDGLVMRYDTAARVDGLPPGEGIFLPCSFWLADNLLLLGRRQEALALFERLLSLRNDVGLLSEEYDPRSKRLLGNFPQALSHIALVNTAYQLISAAFHSRHIRSGNPRSGNLLSAAAAIGSSEADPAISAPPPPARAFRASRRRPANQQTGRRTRR
jgi:GH15 family glucan-1,4-alpha-glucosidase